MLPNIHPRPKGFGISVTIFTPILFEFNINNVAKVWCGNELSNRRTAWHESGCEPDSAQTPELAIETKRPFHSAIMEKER